MSYNIVVALPPIPECDDSAWRQLDQMIESQGPTPSVFRTLHDRLTARYPCICALQDEDLDDGVWSDGPLIDNFGHRAAVLALMTGRAEEVLPFIVNEAVALGLIVFDPVTGAVHRHAMQQPRPQGLAAPEVRQIIKREFDLILSSHGFKAGKQGKFVLRHSEGWAAIWHSFVNNRPWYTIQPFCLVRLKAVEDIRLPFSRIEEKYWPESFSTVFCLPSRPTSLEWEFSDEPGIILAVSQMREWIEDEMVPLAKRCSTPMGLWEELRNPQSRLEARLASPGDLKRDLTLTFLCEPTNLEALISRQVERVAKLQPDDATVYWNLARHLRKRISEQS